MLSKIRAAANVIMVCIAIERTFAALKRDKRRHGELRKQPKSR